MLGAQVFVLGLLCLFQCTYAYIPAVATNDTGVAIANGLNVTDRSKVYLQWYFNSYALCFSSLCSEVD